jgi:hypothetical protein
MKLQDFFRPYLYVSVNTRSVEIQTETLVKVSECKGLCSITAIYHAPRCGC